ncbi:unnamed protein product [Ectocarpus sp. 13 AM-2016]
MCKAPAQKRFSVDPPALLCEHARQERDSADTNTHRSPLRWLPDAPGWCLFTASFGLEHPSGPMSSQGRRAVSRWIFEFEYLNCSIENRRGRRVGQLGKYELR